ncbi:MAG: hypothetical protein JSR99_19605 [Proteobacteria bacterium]|nr:hypothetical protein [Pseudomonadota bacterium]
MQPKVLVLAWALLFVVAFAVVYRFFAWVGRRLRQRRVAKAAPLPVPISETMADAAMAPISGSSTKVSEPKSAPPRDTPALPPTIATAPPPSPPPPPTSAPEAGPRADVTKPTPVAEHAPVARAMPVGAGAVMAARIAAAARTALAPSVAATLPPFRQPSVAATLPPRPVASPVPVPSQQANATVLEERRQPEIVSSADEQEASAVGTAMPESGASASMPLRDPDIGDTQKSILLRAWRLGTEIPSLDLRLRDARDRKAVQTPKTARGSSGASGTRELKVLAPKTVPEKMPARRIGLKGGDEGVLASAKAQTRVVGVPPRVSRVLSLHPFSDLP